VPQLSTEATTALLTAPQVERLKVVVFWRAGAVSPAAAQS
jgi:hypothetical protein